MDCARDITGLQNAAADRNSRCSVFTEHVNVLKADPSDGQVRDSRRGDHARGGGTDRRFVLGGTDKHGPNANEISTLSDGLLGFRQSRSAPANLSITPQKLSSGQSREVFPPQVDIQSQRGGNRDTIVDDQPRRRRQLRSNHFRVPEQIPIGTCFFTDLHHVHASLGQCVHDPGPIPSRAQFTGQQHTQPRLNHGLSRSQTQAKVTVKVVPAMTDGLYAGRKGWGYRRSNLFQNPQRLPDPTCSRGRNIRKVLTGASREFWCEPQIGRGTPLRKQIGQLYFTQLPQTTATCANGLGEIRIFEDQPRQLFQSAQSLPGPVEVCIQKTFDAHNGA